MTTSPESPRDRIARIFAMGDYGKRLAEEILREYGEQIARKLEVDGEDRAAKYVRELNELDWE